MKRKIAVEVVLGCCVGVQNLAQSVPQPANIAPNASPPRVGRQVPLLLELTDTVTQDVKPGIAIHFRVVEDLIDDGFVVVAAGTSVTAKVERVDKHAGPEGCLRSFCSLEQLGV